MSDEKEKYYDISNAWSDVICEYDAKDKVIAGAKFIGKLGFNTLRFAGSVGIKVLQEMPNAIANNTQKQLDQNPDIPAEQRERMESYIEKYKK